MAKAAPSRRPIFWLVGSVVVVVILVVVALVASPGSLSSTTTSTHTTTSTGTSTTSTTTCEGSSSSATISIISGRTVVGTTGKVAEGVQCADGHLGNILSYQYGQQINIQVTVPDSLTPVAIQTVLDGTPQNTNPWDVNSTGHTYVLMFGGAGQSSLTVAGLTHDIYSIVTFSDNSTATSNVVFFTVYGAPPL